MSIRDFKATGPTSGSGSSSADGSKPSDPKQGSGSPDADSKTMTPDAPMVGSPKLDAKNGFLGATFGAKVRELRGLKQTEKNGDRTSYKMPGDRSYSGILLKDVSYTFHKGRLATIGFGVRLTTDCKSVATALKADFGPPQKTATIPNEAYVWKGDKAGLRFAISSAGTCGGVVVSRDLAPPEFAGLEP
ncbi:MAG: hypothetical protein ABIP39_03315 [Polyangiaceae bacterium]